MKKSAFNTGGPACGIWGKRNKEEGRVTCQRQWVFQGRQYFLLDFPILQIVPAPLLTHIVPNSQPLCSILSSWPHIFWFDLQSFHILLLLNQNEGSRSTYNYQCIRKTNPNSSRYLPHRYAFCYHVLFPRNLLVQKAYFILIYLPCYSCMYGTQ